jgi:hypothetical protein
MAQWDIDALILAPCVAAFGEMAQGFDLVTYTPQGAAAFQLDGIFDRAYREIDPLTMLPITSAMPVIGVRVSQFPPGIAPAQGDLLTIRGGFYVVREVRADGHGAAKLMLNTIDPDDRLTG